jgi:hypothetical protein
LIAADRTVGWPAAARSIKRSLLAGEGFVNTKSLSCWVLRGYRRTGLILFLGLVQLSFSDIAARTADGPQPGASKRAPAGKFVTEKGAMARREAPGKPWQLVDRNETLYSGDLLVAKAGAGLASANGAVRLTPMTDLDNLSPFPIRECAVVLQNDPQVDLDFILDRGRVDLVNQKAKGAAKVRVHVRKEAWDLTLVEPGASIALELYGRWPRGAAFTKNPGPKDVPTADLVFLVLRGQVNLQHGGFEHALTAPPGPAMMEWDSVTGMDDTPHRLDQLPVWASPTTGDSPTAKLKKAARDRLQQLILSKGIDAALDTLINSENQFDRDLAIIVMGALDDLPRLGKALREAKHPDVWENGVLTLRHWIGRAPGQDQILYQRLVEDRKFSPVEAETVLQLLHSFSDEELARPETYETLIAYLGHNQLAIRGLAYWHLSRLVPAGKKFGYNPLDPKDKREAAVQQWKKLIPSGQMPPRTKPDNKK